MNFQGTKHRHRPPAWSSRKPLALSESRAHKGWAVQTPGKPCKAAGANTGWGEGVRGKAAKAGIPPRQQGCSGCMLSLGECKSLSLWLCLCPPSAITSSSFPKPGQTKPTNDSDTAAGGQLPPSLLVLTLLAAIYSPSISKAVIWERGIKKDPKNPNPLHITIQIQDPICLLNLVFEI